MNAEHANAIPMPEILSKLGYEPQKKGSKEYLYLSPLREERTASFHVKINGNLWYDFGPGHGGTVVDFVCAYLGSKGRGGSVSDALRFLDGMGTFSLTPIESIAVQDADEGPSLEKVAERPLQHGTLIRYLTDERMIPLALAKKYLVEIGVRNRKTGKSFSVIGMKNEDGAYELRGAGSFKSCIGGRKDVSFFRGSASPATEVHVFEGFMDLLSALADKNVDAFEGDMIVLHSVACVSKARPYLENYESYRRIYSWMDNDTAGEQATKYLQQIAEQQKHLTFHPMNAAYAKCKDVNECRVKRLKGPKLV